MSNAETADDWPKRDSPSVGRVRRLARPAAIHVPSLMRSGRTIAGWGLIDFYAPTDTRGLSMVVREEFDSRERRFKSLSLAL